MLGRTVARARRAFGPRVLVLGDSHAGVFRHPCWRQVPVHFAVHAVDGALVSSSGARFDAVLTHAAANRRPPDAILTLFGQAGFAEAGFGEAGSGDDAADPREAVERYRQLVAEAKTLAPVTVVAAERGQRARLAAMAAALDVTFLDLDLDLDFDPLAEQVDGVAYALVLRQALAPVLGYGVPATRA